jgi:hypothetical protein
MDFNSVIDSEEQRNNLLLLKNVVSRINFVRILQRF